MIPCPRCRTGLDDAAKFCGACGHRLDGRPTAAATNQQPTVAGKGRPPGGIDPLAQTMMSSGPSGFAPAQPHPPQAPAVPRPMPQAPGAPMMGIGNVAPAGPRMSPDQQTFVPPKPAPAPMPGADVDPLVGSVLNGRYRIDGKLGEGGFGAVYKGVQLNMNREVALKVLHPDLKSDANVVARFMREAQASCGLRDAHTITTFDFDKTPDGTLYIAMELLKGHSIHAATRSGPLEWQRVVRILEQMCSSLGEAHGQGIVHRDIKPENIYLERRGADNDFVKVLDFGIAKIMKGDSSTGGNAQLTAMGQTLGTLEYMSPEQLMGKPLDGRSDIYAMGVLGHEMLTGQLPFPHARAPGLLITAQLRETPPPPSQVRPQAGIPPGVDALIKKMLGKQKEERHLDVHALRADCQAILNSGGASQPVQAQADPGLAAGPISPAEQTIPANRGGVPAPMVPRAPGPPSAPAPATAATASAGAGNRNLYLIIAAVIVVGAVIGAIFAFK
ncbi:MAG: protein kinase [Deltaproteobacteria bacterium]|nr:protein kinase [Deltaproteobacteria bacterium]